MTNSSSSTNDDDYCHYFLLVAAFLLLGIERILYGYWYLYPQHFMQSVRQGIFKNFATATAANGASQDNVIEYWKSAMTLGMYVKVFQFSVVTYDLVVRNDSLTVLKSYWNYIDNINTTTAIAGLVLLIIGQGLNYSVFRALGCKGVYYGAEFGYNVPYVSGFPYNIGISDPQYWGVVLCIWGMYLMLQANNYLVPVMETFWYLLSMQLLEHPRGRKLLGMMDGRNRSCSEKSL